MRVISLLIIIIVQISITSYADEEVTVNNANMNTNSVVSNMNPQNIKKPFNLNELLELLNSKQYEDSVKYSLYEGYMNIRDETSITLDISKIITLNLPTRIKKSLVSNRRFQHFSNITIDDIYAVHQWSKANGCPECLEKAYFVGNNEGSITVQAKIKDRIEHHIKNTYLIYPMSLADNPQGFVNYYIFLKSKDSAILFSKNDKVTFICNNISYHKDRDAMIFWGCDISSVNDAPPGGENKLLQEIRMQQKTRKSKLCISPYDIQKKLNYVNINVGKPDGQFGDQTFFGLMDYQRQHSLPITGDADDRTCDSLNAIVIPEEIENKSPTTSIPEVLF